MSFLSRQFCFLLFYFSENTSRTALIALRWSILVGLSAKLDSLKNDTVSFITSQAILLSAVVAAGISKLANKADNMVSFTIPNFSNNCNF